MTNPKTSQGMTLLEIVVAMAIIGILAAVVFPSFLAQLTKTRRSDAKISLSELTQLQENFYATGNVYTTSFSALLGLSSGQTGKYGFEIQSGNLLKSKEGHYQISFPTTDLSENAANNNLIKRFTLRAEPDTTGKQADDTDCKAFEIDATGAKTAEDATGNESEACW